MTAQFLERRRGDRRHECDHWPALHPHSRRAAMLGPVLAVTTLALAWSAGFIAGQVRLSERSRLSAITPAVELLPQYGPPIPASVGVTR
jgi:hypothetical protein